MQTGSWRDSRAGAAAAATAKAMTVKNCILMVVGKVFDCVKMELDGKMFGSGVDALN